MTTVLVVEDEYNIATVVRIALEREGHRVVMVRTGEEALAELPRHPVGLVVLDLGGVSRPAEGRVRQSLP